MCAINSSEWCRNNSTIQFRLKAPRVLNTSQNRARVRNWLAFAIAVQVLYVMLVRKLEVVCLANAFVLTLELICQLTMISNLIIVLGNKLLLLRPDVS